MSVILLDNRGLSPPEPMLRILAACESLQRGDSVEALMDRRPVFLFPELESRGLAYDCDPCGDGSFRVTVKRPL